MREKLRVSKERRRQIDTVTSRGVEVFPPRPLSVLRDFSCIHCSICGGNDRQEDLLRCDACHDEFHYDCAALADQNGVPLLDIPSKRFEEESGSVHDRSESVASRKAISHAADVETWTPFREAYSPSYGCQPATLLVPSSPFLCVNCIPDSEWQSKASTLVVGANASEEDKFSLLRSRCHVYVRDEDGASLGKSGRRSVNSRYMRQPHYRDAFVLRRVREQGLPLVEVTPFDGKARIVSISEVEIASLPSAETHMFSEGALVFLKKEAFARKAYLRDFLRKQLQDTVDGEGADDSDSMDIDKSSGEQDSGETTPKSHVNGSREETRRKTSSSKRPYPFATHDADFQELDGTEDSSSDDGAKRVCNLLSEAHDPYFQPSVVRRVTVSVECISPEDKPKLIPLLDLRFLSFSVQVVAYLVMSDYRYIYEIEKRNCGGVYTVREEDLCPPAFTQAWLQNFSKEMTDEAKDTMQRKRMKMMVFDPIIVLKSAIEEYGASPCLLPRVKGDFARAPSVLTPLEQSLGLGIMVNLITEGYNLVKHTGEALPNPSSLIARVKGVSSQHVETWVTGLKNKIERAKLTNMEDHLVPLLVSLYRHWLHKVAFMPGKSSNRADLVRTLCRLVEWQKNYLTAHLSWRRLRGVVSGEMSLKAALGILREEESDVVGEVSTGALDRDDLPGPILALTSPAPVEREVRPSEAVEEGQAPSSASKKTSNKKKAKTSTPSKHTSTRRKALSLEEEEHLEAQKAEETEKTGCEICGLDHSPDRTIVCDGCDAEYHFDCLVPVMKEVPESNWYCDDCWNETDMNSFLEYYGSSVPFYVPPYLKQTFSEDTNNCFKPTKKDARAALIFAIRRQTHVVTRWGSKKRVYDAVVIKKYWKDDNVYVDLVFLIDGSRTSCHIDSVRLPVRIERGQRKDTYEAAAMEPQSPVPSKNASNPSTPGTPAPPSSKIAAQLLTPITEGSIVRRKVDLAATVLAKDLKLEFTVDRVTAGVSAIFAEITERVPDGVRRPRLREVVPVDTLELIDGPPPRI